MFNNLSQIVYRRIQAYLKFLQANLLNIDDLEQ